MTEMEGGCMSISSLGGIGGTGFTPIVNAPEVAILGITKAEWKPRRGLNDALEWRLKAPLSLSYDHRVINGADAARFLRHLDETLATPQALLAP
jgi:pyruvate dehydrogenase E2 component (dihydrolipoamide acetyltransferase)